jgi:hypothetical protein
MKVKIRNTAADARRVVHAGAILVVSDVSVLEGLDYDVLEPIQATTTNLTPKARALAVATAEPTEMSDANDGKVKGKGK